MTHPLWSVLAVCGIYAVSVASPGPSTVLVVRRSASRQGRALGIAAGLGTTLGSTVYAAGSLFGLTVLLLRLKGLASLVEIAGGAYLVWLGLRALADSRAPISAQRPDAGESDMRLSGRAVFRQALTVNLANPKTAAFFVSLLAPAVGPDTPMWARLAMLAGIVLIDLVYFQGLALTFSRPAVQRAYARARATIERVVGCVLTAFGLGLLVEGVTDVTER